MKLVYIAFLPAVWRAFLFYAHTMELKCNTDET